SGPGGGCSRIASAARRAQNGEKEEKEEEEEEDEEGEEVELRLEALWDASLGMRSGGRAPPRANRPAHGSHRWVAGERKLRPGKHRACLGGGQTAGSLKDTKKSHWRCAAARSILFQGASSADPGASREPCRR
ncbi:unnamed protein product, partial [Prorocentrum cordatum]